MPSNDPSALLILGEISLILFIIVILLLASMLLRKRKQSKQLSAMLQRIAQNEAVRKEALHTLGIDGNLVDEIIANENGFYRLIASAFIDNKLNNIQQLDEEVHKLVSPFEKLISKISESEKAGDNRGNEATAPSFDEAIDDLLSDAGSEAEHNPEFDLSETDGIADAPTSDGLGIAEIPEDLLGDAAEAK